MSNNNLTIELLSRNLFMLAEAVHVASELIKEVAPICGKYHKLILSGQASSDDIKACSKHVQRANRMRKEFNDLVLLYHKESTSSTFRFPAFEIEKKVKRPQAYHE